jgi:hypothetical protein
MSLRAKRGNLEKSAICYEITTGFLPFAQWAKQSLFKIVPYDFMPQSFHSLAMTANFVIKKAGSSEPALIFQQNIRKTSSSFIFSYDEQLSF